MRLLGLVEKQILLGKNGFEQELYQIFSTFGNLLEQINFKWVNSVINLIEELSRS